MDFVTSSVLGGLLFEAIKLGFTSTVEIAKEGLKQLILSDEEMDAIVSALNNSNISETSTQKDIEEAIEKMDKKESVFQSINEKNKSNQINKIQTVNGAVIGTNFGEINMTFGKND